MTFATTVPTINHGANLSASQPSALRVAIVPARNEQRTVGDVVRAIKSCPTVDGVIVVDNASTDKTPEIARAAGASVVLCPIVGKGQAIKLGVDSSPPGTTSFLLVDADLRNLRGYHVAEMSSVFDTSGADMVCGILQDTWWRRLIYGHLEALPIATLTGQRLIKASSLANLRDTDFTGYRIETCLNWHVGRRRTVRMKLNGVTHLRRDQKPVYAPRLRRLAMWLQVQVTYFSLISRGAVRSVQNLLDR